MDAYEVFKRNRRFDLIYKILYIKFRGKSEIVRKFYEDLYLEHIRAFNGFYEESPKKNSKDDFLKCADNLIDSLLLNGFENKEAIPVNEDLELYDGAHRLSFCAFLKKKIEIRKVNHKDKFDYLFFQQRGLDSAVADLGALEYVKYNDQAYIVNLFPIINENNDKKIVDILNKYGFVYYKKSVRLSYNGIVNLKKIHYRGEKWIGDYTNGFAGLRYHADNCRGESPVRALVFVCDSLDKVIQAKNEVRNLFKLGNFPIHINDKRSEAVELAETYFNNNSLYFLNYRPYNIVTEKIDSYVEAFRDYLFENKLNVDDFCACGSTPLGLFGIRDIDDFDFIHINDAIPSPKNENLSSHESELRYYPLDKDTIITDPRYHFYYKGVKFVSLDTILAMKKTRGEKPKDIMDVRNILLFKLRNKLDFIKTEITHHIKKLLGVR